MKSSLSQKIGVHCSILCYSNKQVMLLLPGFNFTFLPAVEDNEESLRRIDGTSAQTKQIKYSSNEKESQESFERKTRVIERTKMDIKG